MRITAYNIERSLSIDQIKKTIGMAPIKEGRTFLMFQTKSDQVIYIKSYGSIVFYNYSKEEELEILNRKFEVTKTENLIKESYLISEDEQNVLNIKSGKIYLSNLDLDTIQIISLNLSHSVSIEFFNLKLIGIIGKLQPYIKKLKTKGRIGMPKRILKRLIGEVLYIRNTMAQDLFIYSKTNIAWKTEKTMHIDEIISEDLDIENRFNGITQNLDVIKHNLEFCDDQQTHKYSIALEWTIIILILIEVIDLLLLKQI